MAEKLTTWRPDTCGCELVYAWDDALDETMRTHTIRDINHMCSAHAGLVDRAQCFAVVLEENSRKNTFFGKIVETIPSAVQERLEDDGSIIRQLTPGRQFSFNYDSNRVLVIELHGFTTIEKTAAQTVINDLFPGKIKMI